MDITTEIPYLKQAGVSPGALSQILEMQNTKECFSRLERAVTIPVGEKAWSCFSYRTEPKHTETLVKPTQGL